MRILTWNILAMRGFLLGEDPQNNPAPPRPEIVGLMSDALKPLDLDVIALQEAPDEDRVQELARLLEMNVHYCSAGWPGNEKWFGGFPGALLSRATIDDARDLRVEHNAEQYEDCFKRHWGSISVSGITIHSLHLSVHGSEARLGELRLLLEHAAREKTIICGDFNFKPDSDEYACMHENGFIDTFDNAAADAFPFSVKSIGPTNRIDYIWVSSDLQANVQSCEILHREPYGPRASDDLALSDHLPVLSELNIKA